MDENSREFSRRRLRGHYIPPRSTINWEDRVVKKKRKMRQFVVMKRVKKAENPFQIFGRLHVGLPYGTTRKQATKYVKSLNDKATVNMYRLHSVPVVEVPL